MEEADVEFVRRELRRGEDPSGPRVWQTALAQLLTRLAGSAPALAVAR